MFSFATFYVKKFQNTRAIRAALDGRNLAAMTTVASPHLTAQLLRCGKNGHDAQHVAAGGHEVESMLVCKGLLRELNPGPLAPEARIMPLDQAADDSHADLVAFWIL